MKVWLIIRHDWEDYEVLGIAINKKVAKQIREKDKLNYQYSHSYRWIITKHKVNMGEF